MLQKPASHRRALLGYALAFPLAALLSMCTQSEQDQPQSEAGQARLSMLGRAVKVDGRVYDLVEESPTFPGGTGRLGEYLIQHIHYPAAAEKANVGGTVFVNFVLTKEGEITDVKSLKSVGFGLDEEAVRVVSQMPRWNPARQGNKAVNVRYNLPIRFQPENSEESTMKKSGIIPAPRTSKSAFFSFPSDDASLQASYKHFIVNGQELTFTNFKKYPKYTIVEASSSEQLIRVETE